MPQKSPENSARFGLPEASAKRFIVIRRDLKSKVGAFGGDRAPCLLIDEARYADWREGLNWISGLAPLDSLACDLLLKSGARPTNFALKTQCGELAERLLKKLAEPDNGHIAVYGVGRYNIDHHYTLRAGDTTIHRLRIMLAKNEEPPEPEFSEFIADAKAAIKESNARTFGSRRVILIATRAIREWLAGRWGVN